MKTHHSEQAQATPNQDRSAGKDYAKDIAVAGVGALMVGGALYGINNAHNPEGVPEKAQVCVPVGHTEVQPQATMGKDNLILDIGGVEYQGNFKNDPCYEAKAELVDEVIGNGVVSTDKVYDLPAAVFPEDQVPEGSVIYTIDHK
jgi:hypothetical protein